MHDWNYIYKKHGVIQKDVMPVVKKFKSFLLKQKRKEYKLLDLGCGTGRHTMYVLKHLCKAGTCAKLDAIDNSRKAVTILNNIIKKEKTKNSNLDFKIKVGDLKRKLPYTQASIDGIISTLVIQHGVMSEIKSCCSEMKRVLRKKGLLCLAVISTKDPRYKTGEEVENGTRINTKQKDGKVPHHFFTDKEIENKLFNGFKVIYKKLQSRKSAVANLTAKHWEYVLLK